MNRRKSTLGQRRAVPLPSPVRLMNLSRRSPRLGTLGLEPLSSQKSGQKSSFKKRRLCDRLRESLAPSQVKQPQQMNYASKIEPKKNVFRRLDLKGLEESEQLLGASNVVGTDHAPLSPITSLPTGTSSPKPKRKSLPRKVVHSLKTKEISSVRKTMGTGIPLPKYYSSQIKQETKLPPHKIPSSQKVQEKKFPLLKIQPSRNNCSTDSIAKFERDEACVVTSTPAVKTTSPFGAVRTLVGQQQPHQIDQMSSETLREIKNFICEGFKKQNKILEEILQEQRAQTEIMKNMMQPQTRVQLLQPQTSQRLGTPRGTPRSKLVKNYVKATPRTQRTVIDRIAQEQENLLSNSGPD